MTFIEKWLKLVFISTDKVHLSSVHEAVRFGDVLEMQAMVQRGAGLNELDAKFKFTPLHWAAHHGTLEVCKEQSSNSVNLDADVAFLGTWNLQQTLC